MAYAWRTPLNPFASVSKVLEPLDVPLQALPPRAPGRLALMAFGGHDQRGVGRGRRGTSPWWAAAALTTGLGLAELAEQRRPDLRVAPLGLVVHRLAQVVQEPGPAGQGGVEPELGGHHAAEVRDPPGCAAARSARSSCGTPAAQQGGRPAGGGWGRAPRARRPCRRRPGPRPSPRSPRGRPPRSAPDGSRPSATSRSSVTPHLAAHPGRSTTGSPRPACSSMITSTPVVFSNERMLRPSRPDDPAFHGLVGDVQARHRVVGGLGRRVPLDGLEDDGAGLLLGLVLGGTRPLRRNELRPPRPGARGRPA